MASIDRAYGLRGAVLGLAVSVVAGAVHGVLSGVAEAMVIQAFLLIAAMGVMGMAGAVSARRSLGAALALAGAMTAIFIWTRWVFWSVGADGGQFIGLAPGAWPSYLGAVAPALWLAELLSVAAAAGIGCWAGHERRA